MSTTIFFAGSIRSISIKNNPAAWAEAWNQAALSAESNGYDLVVFRIPTTDSFLDSDVEGIECFLQGLHPDIVKQVTDRRSNKILDQVQDDGNTREASIHNCNSIKTNIEGNDL